MKHIIESIIGRKGATLLPSSFKDLRYGDVVEIYDEGDISARIYMPLKNIKRYALDYDAFVAWSNNDFGISC